MLSDRLRPLARAVRVPPVMQRSTMVLARALEEEIFRAADVLSEGSCRVVAGAGESYFGSTMIRVPLAPLQVHARGGLDATSRRTLADAVEGSARVRLRAMRLAIREATRRVAGLALGTAQVEIQVRLDDDHLHIDVDLEVPVGVSSRAGLP